VTHAIVLTGVNAGRVRPLRLGVRRWGKYPMKHDLDLRLVVDATPTLIFSARPDLTSTT
jgi:hypothetical protein